MLGLALLLAVGPPLKSPAPVIAKATGPYSALISWKAPPDALGVEVEVRRTAGARGGPQRWTRLFVQPARPPEFTAHALPPGAALELRARSWNGRAPSEWTKPVPLRTQPYVEPPLAITAPCVAREALLETALGHAPAACDARKLQSAKLAAGALELVLVDPVSDAPSCHAEGGNLDEAFADVGGCLRPVGKLIERTRPIALPQVAVPPLRSFWQTGPKSGLASIVELRDGHLAVVDEGPIDAASEALELPATTDFELVSQLQGAGGASALDR